jgi:hypothetical protein
MGSHHRLGGPVLGGDIEVVDAGVERLLQPPPGLID